MSAPNGGGSAFPGYRRIAQFDPDGCPMGSALVPEEGMTLRDWFAGQALVALLARDDITSNSGGPVTADMMAQSVYEVADAMLAARKVTP